LPDSAATVAANPIEEVEPLEVPNEGGRTVERLGQFSSLTADPVEDKKKRATRIPENFQPDAAIIAWTKEHCPDIDARAEWAQFCDAAERDDKRYVMWDRAWHTWARNAQKWTVERRSRQTKQQRQRAAAPSGVMIADDTYPEGRYHPDKRIDFDALEPYRPQH